MGRPLWRALLAGGNTHVENVHLAMSRLIGGDFGGQMERFERRKEAASLVGHSSHAHKFDQFAAHDASF